mgnify:CR=1 FL=1
MEERCHGVRKLFEDEGVPGDQLLSVSLPGPTWIYLWGVVVVFVAVVAVVADDYRRINKVTLK